jgi:TolB-like protein/DNA-binding winged helix-turn-helix (wHTH) protein/Tfp pilus assembly protein PilF
MTYNGFSAEMSTPAPEASRRVLRFGRFEANLRTRELRKHGTRVKLPAMPFEILAALIERPGDLVTREELRQRLWPQNTFVDYENSLNSSVARLREALSDSAERPIYIETLPKRGYRFVAEVTEEPISPLPLEPPGTTVIEPSTDRPVIDAAPEPPVARSRRRLHVALACAVVLVAAAIAVLRTNARGPESVAAGRVMLAVLPFANLSQSADQDYLSDGFTEELITQLARVTPEKLGVIARTTAMRYKGTPTDIAQVGRELHVDYVLEGSVRQGDGALRITAQLIRVADQTHVWAESFDREPRNLLEVERDVSEAVSRQVHLLVGATTGEQAAISRPVHPDAYEAYLRARYHHAQATVPGLESAIQFYRRALEIDPAYARAHAGLARAYIFGVRMRPRAALEQAHAQAQKALSLDPELPEAQLARAMTTLYYEWDWTGAEREFKRAITRDNGNADAHFYYSHYLAAVGRHDEAIAEARRAQQLDPYSPLIAHYVGRHYYMARRYDRAIEELRRTLDLDPNYGWTHVFLFLTYEKLGKFEQALAHRQKYLTLIGRSPEEASELATRYATRGYAAVTEKWIDVTLDYFKRDGHLTSAEIVHGYAALERSDDALRWLDRAFADHTRDLIFLNVDPGYDALRDAPRFRMRLREMRLAT